MERSAGRKQSQKCYEGLDIFVARFVFFIFLKGIGTNNHELIRIICQRDRDHLLQVRMAYRDMFHKHLVHDIKGNLLFFSVVYLFILNRRYELWI